MMRQGAIHFLQTDASVAFLYSYFESLTEDDVITNFSDQILDIIKHSPLNLKKVKIYMIFESLYKKCSRHQKIKIDSILLPIICDQVLSQDSSALVTTFIRNSDELSLIFLTDFLSANLTFHLILQK